MVLVEFEDDYYEEKEREPTEYAKIFLQRLKGQSINKHNYLAEWEYITQIKVEKDNHFIQPGVKYLLGQTPKGCICTHYIQNINLIKNIRRGIILQIGKCCAKRFLPYHRKTCEICSGLHKRKKSNVCSKCETFSYKKIDFGKHKGTSYYDLLKKDKQYVKWLLSIKQDLKKPNKHLTEFLEAVELTLERYGLIEKEEDNNKELIPITEFFKVI